MAALKDKIIFVTGASRGIGLAIAKRAAIDGAKIVIAAKSAEPHRYLPGTIYTAADELRKLGGDALPIVLDVRDELAVEKAVAQAADKFGGIDICINNASAVSRTPVDSTTAKQFDLMNSVNGRGTFTVSRACLPYLRKADNPHILNLAPPINLDPVWFDGHVAYTMSKYAMSLCTLGMAAELRRDGIAVNALWPRFGIATAAIEHAFANREELQRCRKPEIMADAAYTILTRPSRQCTGNFFIDDLVLYASGTRDFDQYRVDPAKPTRIGMFVPDDMPPPLGVNTSDAYR